MNRILIFLVLTLGWAVRSIDQPTQPVGRCYNVSNHDPRQFTANYQTDEATGRSDFMDQPIQFKITFNSDTMIVKYQGRVWIALKSDTMGSEFRDSVFTYKIDGRSVLVFSKDRVCRFTNHSML